MKTKWIKLHPGTTTILKGWNQSAQGCEERATLGLPPRTSTALKGLHQSVRPLPVVVSICTKWISFTCIVLVTFGSAAIATTNDLSAELQRGLFEEEANHNLDAAIQGYQSVINQYDKDRKLAATAIFRLGESYRKQGKTNEAAVQYERVLREFADQSELLSPSRQNLTMLGRASTAAPVAPQAAREEQKRLLEEEIKLAEKDLSDAQKQRQNGAVSEDVVRSAQRSVLQLKRQLATLEAQPVADILSDATVAGPATSTEAEEIKRIQAMIKDSPDLINSPDQKGETWLQKAAGKGESTTVKLLLDSGAAVNGIRQVGLTALHYAAGNGHKAVVDLLLSRKANVDERTEGGVTALHLAALKGYELIAKTLLGAGGDVNACLSKDAEGRENLSYSLHAGQTPLHAAAEGGYPALVDLLLSKGAPANIEDASGRTALSYAVEGRNQPIAKSLLAAKADPNAGRLNLPLNEAAWNGDVALLELLLTNGANPNTNSLMKDISTSGGFVPQGGNFSPLFLAINQRHPEAVRLLIRSKADPNAVGLLFSALSDQATLNALLDGGANPNVPDQSGVSALERATRANNEPAVKVLLAHHGNITPSPSGWTPLHSAAAVGNYRIADLLLNNGADVNARMNDGDTPLHLAVKGNHKDIVNLLLANKADPNARNSSGKTALDLTESALTMPPYGSPLPSPHALPPRNDSSAPGAVSSGASIAELLRQHGAVEHAPNPGIIDVGRPPATAYALRNHNEWDKFTLLETVGIAYSLLAGRAQDNRSELQSQQVWADQHHTLAFPDFARVKIRRPAADLKSWQDRTVDITGIFVTGDCSKDLRLEWGDVVEIPEAEHPLNENWGGFSTNEFANLKKCLSREVEIVVKGHATKIILAPEINNSTILDANHSIPQPEIKTGMSFWIKPALLGSRLLLTSSDLSQIKVTRRDPASGQKREWVLDCSDSKPAPDFWLRDGDVIEVPDKS